jgi:hypothetical protein
VHSITVFLVVPVATVPIAATGHTDIINARRYCEI